jgi:hypothetical protein
MRSRIEAIVDIITTPRSLSGKFVPPGRRADLSHRQFAFAFNRLYLRPPMTGELVAAVDAYYALLHEVPDGR